MVLVGRPDSGVTLFREDEGLEVASSVEVFTPVVTSGGLLSLGSVVTSALAGALELTFSLSGCTNCGWGFDKEGISIGIKIGTDSNLMSCSL